MKTYNPIADGDYMLERIEILKDLCVWRKMTEEEKRFFLPCSKCKRYKDYAESKDSNICPCTSCENSKTEICVDNRMIELQRKYF